MSGRVVDPDHFKADRVRNQFFILMGIRIQLLTSMWIWILVIVMGIFDHWSIDPPGLHCLPPLPSAILISVEPRNFDFSVDPETAAFHSNADLESQPPKLIQIRVDPDPQPCHKMSCSVYWVRLSSRFYRDLFIFLTFP